jgi:hypothetical protein
MTFETDTEPYAKTRDAKVTRHHNKMFNYLNVATALEDYREQHDALLL